MERDIFYLSLFDGVVELVSAKKHTFASDEYSWCFLIMYETFGGKLYLADNPFGGERGFITCRMQTRS